jgi:cellulose synthase/poly-beta-1,6-N-acetylglucosamine synthase-like glycosyltransferase
VSVRVSIVCPVLNETPWIGYSIMAALPYVHEFIYALDAKSDDGTRELLHHVKDKYAHERLSDLRASDVPSA